MSGPLWIDDPAFGTYEIRNVPTDMKGVRVVVWHERAGFVPDAKGTEIDLSQTGGGCSLPG